MIGSSSGYKMSGEKKGIHSSDTEKEIIVSAGIRTLVPWITGRTLRRLRNAESNERGEEWSRN